MTLLVVVGIASLLFAVACAYADSQPPIDPDDQFVQPTHVRLLDDQEPAA